MPRRRARQPSSRERYERALERLKQAALRRKREERRLADFGHPSQEALADYDEEVEQARRDYEAVCRELG
jgi:hypothetical protein